MEGLFFLCKMQYVQAHKATYSLIYKSRQLLLRIDVIFQLFDHTGVPIFYMVVRYVGKIIIRE